eukprot:gene13632-16050_t
MLQGLIHGSDVVAIKQILKALGLDKVPATLPNQPPTTTELLEIIKISLGKSSEDSNLQNTTRIPLQSCPVVIVMDDFEYFVRRQGKQLLLYNLLNITHYNTVSLSFIPITRDKDISNAFEKRVKSRFEQTKLILSHVESFDQMKQIIQSLLTVDNHYFSDKFYGQTWNGTVDKLLFSNPVVSRSLFQCFQVSRSVPHFKQIMSFAMDHIDDDNPMLTEKMIVDAVKRSQEDSYTQVFATLSILEFTILGCIAKIYEKRREGVRNITFNDLYETEYKSFSMSYYRTADLTNRSSCMAGIENLLRLGIIKNHGTLTGEHVIFNLSVEFEPRIIAKAARAREDCPTALLNTTRRSISPNIHHSSTTQITNNNPTHAIQTRFQDNSHIPINTCKVNLISPVPTRYLSNILRLKVAHPPTTHLIPQRTLSAPASLEEQQQHAANVNKHYPNKTMGQQIYVGSAISAPPQHAFGAILISTPPHHQSGYPQPPPQFRNKPYAQGPPEMGFPPPGPYGYQPGPPGYYPAPYPMAIPPEMYQMGPMMQQGPPQPPQPTVTPQPRKPLTIVDPSTNKEINTSPPKANAPIVPTQSPPSFSLGNSSLRRQKANNAASAPPTPEKDASPATPATPEKETVVVATPPAVVAAVETTTTTTTTTPVVVAVEETTTPKEEVVVVKQEEVAAVVVTPQVVSDDSRPLNAAEVIAAALAEKPAVAVESLADQVAEKMTIKDDEPVVVATTTATTTVESPAPVVVESPVVVVEENKTPVVADVVATEETTTPVADEKLPETESAESTAVSTPVAQEEEEEEEWETKGDEPVTVQNNNNNNTSYNSISPAILSSSGTNPFALRSSGGVIRYSTDEMLKLRPQHTEPKPELKDLGIQDDRGMKHGGGPPQNKMGNNQNNRMNMGSVFPGQPINKMAGKNMPMNNNYNNNKGGFNQQQFGNKGGFNQYGGYQQQIQQQFGNQHQQQQPQLPPPVILPVSENRWVPTRLNQLSESQLHLRKAKFILNRISPEKFDSLSQNLLDLGITRDTEVFTGVISLIFEKAITEAKYVTMYTDLCRKIFTSERVAKDSDKEKEVARVTAAGGDVAAAENDDAYKPKFRTHLLKTCQEEYEKVTKIFDTIDEVPEDLEPQERTDFEEKQFIQRKKIFGLIKFIAELFKQDMLSEKVIHGILVALMGELVKPQEIKLECFCKLLSPIGNKIISKKGAEEFMRGYYQRMETLISSPTLSQRIKFLIQNVLDLKNNGWRAKPEDAPKVQQQERNPEEDRKNVTGVRIGGATKPGGMFGGNSLTFTRPGMGAKPNVPPMMTNKYAPVGGMAINKPVMPPTSIQKKLGGSPSPAMSTSTTSSSSNASRADNKNAWDNVCEQVNDSINEFLTNNEVPEFIEDLKEYVPSADLYPNVVCSLLSSAVEKPKASKDLTELTIDLVSKSKFFSVEVFSQGFDKFTQTFVDIIEDRPAAYTPIAHLCYTLFNSGILALAPFSKSLSLQVSSVGSFVSKILFEFIIQMNDYEKAGLAFKEKNIDITTFFESGKDQKSISESFINHREQLSTFLDKINFKP